MPTWLGLNKLCEERFLGYSGEGYVDVLRPDDEATTDPLDAGWSYFLGLDLSEYDSDADRGKVVHLAGDDWNGFGAFIIGDMEDESYNGGDVEFNYTGGRVTMWFKNNNISEPVELWFFAMNDYDALEQGLVFVTDDGTDGGSPGGTLTFYLGSELNDGEWHYVEFDLPNRMQQFGAAPEFVAVNAFVGSGLALDINIDDLVLGGGLLGKSYQIIPGAAIGGYIGAQSGMTGSHYDDFYTTATIPAYGKYYYNYNDLGTVTSTVDDTGAVIGVYVPDFFGNYRYVDGDRPDRLGLQSNFEDPTAGLNYGKARWYDRERGRWVSEEPLGLDGPNLYQFTFNTPSSFVDANGLQISTNPEHFKAILPPRTQRLDVSFNDPYNYSMKMEGKLFLDIPDPYGGGFRHCVWACLEKRSWGPLAIIPIGLHDTFLEDVNSKIPGRAQDSINDIKAEEIGCEVSEGRGTCVEECLKKYPSPYVLLSKFY